MKLILLALILTGCTFESEPVSNEPSLEDMVKMMSVPQYAEGECIVDDKNKEEWQELEMINYKKIAQVGKKSYLTVWTNDGVNYHSSTDSFFSTNPISYNRVECPSFLRPKK
jgi:hypothetical protein